ncbi:2OG-Fe(II) oxygenase [bacterium]|nr:2OG-Fe(II) oxygenase [bacterium]
MHEGIIIIDNVVDQSFIDGLVAQTNFSKSNSLPVGGNANDFERSPTAPKNHRCRIINEPIINDDVIINIFNNVNNDHFKLDIDWTKCTPISYIKKYAETDAGFLTWHDDILPEEHPEFGWRCLSMSIILEDQFEGGDLEFKSSWESEDILEMPKQKINQAIIFKPQLPHRVSLVTEGVRTVLVTWLFSEENIYA